MLGHCEFERRNLKPPRFDYIAPWRMSGALDALAQYGSEAKVLAGGQSLVPLLNMRLAAPGVLIDINRVDDSTQMRINGSLLVGPLTRQAEIEASPEIGKQFPILLQAIGWVGHSQIRNRGTVLGSLAHADPAAELPVVFLALDAEMTVAKQSGTRVVSASEFFVHIMETTLEPDELLVEAHVPMLPAGAGSAFLEVARRHGDFAVASAAVALSVEAGTVIEARIALGGVGPTPVRASRAERFLTGAEPAMNAFAEAAKLAAVDVEPASDIHGTAEYRRDVVRALVERGLRIAAHDPGIQGEA